MCIRDRLDTLADLAHATEAVLRDAGLGRPDGLPLHSLEEYRHFVGNGARRLIERAAVSYTHLDVYKRQVMDNGVIQQIGSPQDIYNEPENAFVADFIGESNILDGIMHELSLIHI